MIHGRRLHWLAGALVLAAVVISGVPPGSPSVHSGVPRLGVTDFVRSTATTNCSAGTDPGAPSYDSVHHSVYVPDLASGSVTVLQGNCHLLGVVSLPNASTPFAAAFDPLTNHTFVTDGSSRLYEVAGLKVVATIGGFNQPEGVVFDPILGEMVVANFGGNSVSLVSGGNISKTVAVGRSPAMIAYDPIFRTLLVTNSNSHNVTILRASNLAHLTDVTVHSTPVGVAYDPADHRDYVSNALSNSVSVLFGNGTVTATITGFNFPTGVAYSPSTRDIYVVNQNGTVDLLNRTGIVRAELTATGAGTGGVVYDATNGRMYVTGGSSNSIYIIR